MVLKQLGAEPELVHCHVTMTLDAFLSQAVTLVGVGGAGIKQSVVKYRPYAIPRVTKRTTDSGRKSGYYAIILSGKEDLSMECKYSEAICELTMSTRPASKLIRFSEH